MDRTDFAIVDLLQNDGRLSNKELAAKVKLAPSSCLTRVKALQKAGVIRGYHAEVAGAALGIGVEAMVLVRMVQHERASYQRLWQHVMSLPEVLSLFHVSGDFDLQIHVAVRNLEHLRDFIMDHLATRQEVDRFETSVIFRSERRHRLPRYNSDHQASIPITGGSATNSRQ